MKRYSISVGINDIATEVYRVTANAAVERGDAAHVATEDNEGMVERFVIAALPVLRGAIGRYDARVEYAGGNVEVDITLPDNWRGTAEELKAACMEYLIHMAVAGWYELAGTADRNINAANVALSGLGIILDRRTKPVR